MFKLDSKVELFGNSRTGYVVGYAYMRETPMVLVELDQGFYNNDETIYVSVLLVHPESIRLI